MSHVPPPAPPEVTRAPPPPFQSELEHNGRDAAWLRLHGELDLTCAKDLTASVERALSGARLLAIDLRDLTFVDSAGIHALVDADNRAHRSGRRLVLVRGRGQVRRMFELLGVADWLNIVDLKPVGVTPSAPPPTRPS